MDKKIILAGPNLCRNYSLKAHLEQNNYSILTTNYENQLINAVLKFSAFAVVMEHSADLSWDSLQIAEHIKKLCPTLPIILVVAKSSEDLAIKALRIGVADYYKLPLQNRALVNRLAGLQKADENAQEKSRTAKKRTASISSFIGQSSKIQEVKCAIEKYSLTNSNVLITGETGTGKELVARLIHNLGSRSTQPLVCINCAAIPDTLLESELFGYEKGAFTGAQQNKEGKLMHANSGTLFLDEIGDMSSLAQAKILRAIETKVIQRLGGKHTMPVDIRIVAATNQELEQLVSDKQFRKDLFFRLNVARVHLLPLRERKEDIGVLCEHFIKELNAEFSLAVNGLSEEVLDHFIHYDWPGNVRELRNIMEVAFINHPGHVIEMDNLPEFFRAMMSDKSKNPVSSQDEERDTVLAALLATNWNKSKAAEKLNWSRMTLYRKMHKYQIISSVEPDSQTTTTV
jgi:DNA-binding NtrC family response regulator